MRRVHLPSLHSTIWGKPNPRNQANATAQPGSMDGVEADEELARPPASSESEDELSTRQEVAPSRPAKRRKTESSPRQPETTKAFPSDDDLPSGFGSSQPRKSRTYSRPTGFNVPKKHGSAKKDKAKGAEQDKEKDSGKEPSFKKPALWRAPEARGESPAGNPLENTTKKTRGRRGQKNGAAGAKPAVETPNPEEGVFKMPATRHLIKKLELAGSPLFSRHTESPGSIKAPRSDSGSSLSSAVSEIDEVENSFSADPLQDASDDFLFSQPCPVCKKNILQSTWRLFKSTLPENRRNQKLNTRQEIRFCDYHSKRSAKREFDRRKYPQIDWSSLPIRVQKLQPEIDAIIDGKTPSPYSDNLVNSHDSGKGRRKRLASELEGGFGAERVGYYGGRGAQVIGEEVAKMCHEKLRSNLDHEIIGAAGGIGLYIQVVMVPEVASRLVMEDMGCDVVTARNVLVESAEIGRELNEELDDEVREEPESEAD